MAYKIFLTAITILMMVGDVYGSERPDIGDALKETDPPVRLDEQKQDIPKIEEEPVEKPMQSLGGRRVRIESIKVQGNNVLSSQELEKLVNTEEFTGKRISLKDMEEAAAVITRYYRDQGYFVARAYIPEQEIQDGELTIAIIEGEYGQFRLKNKSLVRDSLLQGMLDAVKDKEVISVNTIERAMLLINDTPGARVTQADVMPGGETGASDFAITADPAKRFSGYVVGDNYGSRYTGEERLSAGFDLNSPLKIGDKLSFYGMLTDKRNLENYRIGYSLPLSYTGMRAELAYSQTEYELGEEYSELDAVGTSEEVELEFTYPLIRTRLTDLQVYTNLSTRYMTDEIQVVDIKTKKQAESMTFGLDFTKDAGLWEWATQSTIVLEYTLGKLTFDDPDNKAADEAGADTAGTYSKVDVTLEEIIDFNRSWSLESSLDLQYALDNKNLDGSEDLFVGGIEGVKLYPSGEVSAENGYIFNVELLYSLPEFKGYTSRLGLFYDAGRAYMADNTVDFDSRTLQDAGISYYANYESLFLKTHWAHKVGSTDIRSEPDTENKFLLQAGIVY